MENTRALHQLHASESLKEYREHMNQSAAIITASLHSLVGLNPPRHPAPMNREKRRRENKGGNRR